MKPSLNQQVVPLGKHKGEPLEVLLSDLEAQRWWTEHRTLKDRFPWVIQFIEINGRPSRTPQHNRFQIQFLDEALRRKTFSLFAQKRILRRFPELRLFTAPDTYSDALLIQTVEAGRESFEEENVDVQFDGSFYFQLRSKEPCQGLKVRTVDTQFPPREIREEPPLLREFPYFIQFTLIRRLKTELKPLLGDDYPDVLRKMAAKKTDCLVYQKYDGSVPMEQVELFFGSRGIVVLDLAEIELIRLPDLRAKDDWGGISWYPLFEGHSAYDSSAGNVSTLN